jgi:hypothetical protein
VEFYTVENNNPLLFWGGAVTGAWTQGLHL